MAFFTPQSVRRYAVKNLAQSRINKGLRESDTYTVRLFLSHSHSDLQAAGQAAGADILKSIIDMLSDLNVRVYIDSLDPTMPSATNAITAANLRQRIRQCQKFVVVATENALSSRWVPWELGYADGLNDMNRIAVLPLVNSQTTTWPQSEYFGLYSRIEADAPMISYPASLVPPEPVVVRIDGTRTKLEAWLRS